MVEGPDPNPDEVILNCYRLADRYKLNPAVFLNSPLSEVNLHIHFTIKLVDAQKAAREYARERGMDDE